MFSNISDSLLSASRKPHPLPINSYSPAAIEPDRICGNNRRILRSSGRLIGKSVVVLGISQRRFIFGTRGLCKNEVDRWWLVQALEFIIRHSNIQQRQRSQHCVNINFCTEVASAIDPQLNRPWKMRSKSPSAESRETRAFRSAVRLRVSGFELDFLRNERSYEKM